MNIDILNNFFFFKNSFTLKDHCVISVVGSDGPDYFQRQLTSDFSLHHEIASLTARLDRSGKIFSFFYLYHDEENTYLFVHKDLVDKTLEELNKFIIMEDIVFTIEKLCINISTHSTDLSKKINFLDQELYFTLSEHEFESTITQLELNKLITLRSWPTYNVNIFCDELVNETRLNELAVSYSKGCFLGQETASKIESRRGAAKYPALIVSDKKLPETFKIQDKKFKAMSEFKNEKYYISAKIVRDFQIDNYKLQFEDTDLVIRTYSKNKISKQDISEYFYNKAVRTFHEKKIDEALEILDQLITYDSNYADAYETKGVILGNSGNYEKAISTMDELLRVNEDSVMAHTNKSLYLMKLGKIEEAEEEKSLATLASFKQFGDEAKEKKLKEEQEQKEKADRERRFLMFNKVLEIDQSDTVANYGLADIFFSRGEIDTSLKHINIVLNEDPKYSVAYLLKSKILYKNKDYKGCLKTIEEGISVATSKGDLMPANEMQVLKTKIDNMSL